MKNQEPNQGLDTDSLEDGIAESAIVNVDELLAIATDGLGQSVLLFKNGSKLAVTEQLKTKLAATLIPT
jgi:hypothetical protein